MQLIWKSASKTKVSAYTTKLSQEVPPWPEHVICFLKLLFWGKWNKDVLLPLTGKSVWRPVINCHHYFEVEVWFVVYLLRTTLVKAGSTLPVHVFHASVYFTQAVRNLELEIGLILFEKSDKWLKAAAQEKVIWSTEDAQLRWASTSLSPLLLIHPIQPLSI